MNSLIEQIESLGISGVSNDFEQIKFNYVYVAIRGLHFNGNDFITQAIHYGARAIILELKDIDLYKIAYSNVQFIQTNNARKSLSILAAYFYKQYDTPYIVAVTGTNGKTSTGYFYSQICAAASQSKSGMIGTLGALVFDKDLKVEPQEFESHLTTPDALNMHKILQHLSYSCKYISLEASSHGLDQDRISNINITAAAFTNLSHDHLDYHNDMDKYFKCKQFLFKELLSIDGVAVLNAGISKPSKEYLTLKQICKEREISILSYGWRIGDLQIITKKRKLFLLYRKQLYNFNISNNITFLQRNNLLAAIGLAISSGLSIIDILNTIPLLKLPPGRIEYAGSYNMGNIYIDYAHTPHGLYILLKEFRKNHKGKLHIIFGCGGDRDKSKRSKMGLIAHKLCDNIIITDDNPRNENAGEIRKEILKSCPMALEIPDRKKAICYGIKALTPASTLLIVGKGHENYQIVGDTKYKFNDLREVSSFLNEQKPS